MTKLKDIPYSDCFYWKGKRYKKVIRPKNPIGAFKIYCQLSNDPYLELILMPAGRNVKKILRVENVGR